MTTDTTPNGAPAAAMYGRVEVVQRLTPHNQRDVARALLGHGRRGRA